MKYNIYVYELFLTNKFQIQITNARRKTKALNGLGINKTSASIWIYQEYGIKNPTPGKLDHRTNKNKKTSTEQAQNNNEKNWQKKK